MNLKEVEKEFKHELLSPTSDLTVDLLEIGLDDIFDNELVKEIPIVKTMATICKVGLNIKERSFTKKLFKFIIDFQNGKFDAKKRDKFINDMKNDDKYSEKVIEVLITAIDKANSMIKIKVMSNLLISYINEKITWDEFITYTDIVDYLVKEDYEVLKLLIFERDRISFAEKEYSDFQGSAFKLLQFGLLNISFSTTTYVGSSPTIAIHQVSKKGIEFYAATQCCDINIKLSKSST